MSSLFCGTGWMKSLPKKFRGVRKRLLPRTLFLPVRLLCTVIGEVQQQHYRGHIRQADMCMFSLPDQEGTGVCR
ncbi:hypothetical protein NDU88_000840 [Pleurodeles waltl]|uniref:Uncharacterized protein n=1 Tax=Pleurodeles waltl TaxID=8319 RepID=A0AAV7Q6V2_PLEWA|nr:hypothetical protein NDU88_000840 [Pleurodeles waltl]